MKKELLYKSTIIASAIILSLSLIRSVSAIDTNAPSTVYDDFSGNNIIIDKSYSTGVDLGGEIIPQTSFLNFSNLIKGGLTIDRVKSIQSILSLKFPSAEYLSLKNEEIKPSNNTLKTALQVNRSNNLIYSLEVQFNPQVETAIIITLKKDDEQPFIYINKLNDYTDGSSSIRQKNSTSTDLLINSTNKESALSVISTHGYAIPDLSITFSNYRSPF